MQLKQTKWVLMALAMLGLSANVLAKEAEPVQANVQFDAYQEVAYQCQGGRVLALYGIKNNIVAGVQVVFDGIQSPLLLRTNNPKYNEFSSSGRHVTWTQNLAAPAQIKSADARGLTRLVGDNAENLAIGLVVEKCKVDAGMMAKLDTLPDAEKIQWLNSK